MPRVYGHQPPGALPQADMDLPRWGAKSETALPLCEATTPLKLNTPTPQVRTPHWGVGVLGCWNQAAFPQARLGHAFSQKPTNRPCPTFKFASVQVCMPREGGLGVLHSCKVGTGKVAIQVRLNCYPPCNQALQEHFMNEYERSVFGTAFCY
jgi:hypothetical protein